jgi:hypothetical protein
MTTSSKLKAQPQPKAIAPVAVLESTESTPEPQATDFNAALAASIDAIPAATPTLKEEILQIASDASTEAPALPAAKTTKRGAKPGVRRGGDRVLSCPAGPFHSKKMDDAGWTFPKDGYVMAIAQLLALKPGISPVEISSIIHTNELDGDGLPARLSTTHVYPGWNFVTAGMGIERKDGGWHLLLPNGRTMDEVKSFNSKKLKERATLNGRLDIVQLVEDAAI